MSARTHTGSRRPSARRGIHWEDILLGDFREKPRRPARGVAGSHQAHEYSRQERRHHSSPREASRKSEPQRSHHQHRRHHSHSAPRLVEGSSAPRATNPSVLAEPRVDNLQKERRRPTSLLSLLFNPPAEKAVKRVACSAKLACSHRMCYTCLRRLFTLSVTDPQHMPPRCCTQDQIPARYVEILFDQKFKTKWDQKYKEYTTKNRYYCPSKDCGEWIKPSQIFKHRDTGRKYGQCSRCKTKVCCMCRGKWHGNKKECPKDESVQKLEEMAQQQGWKRCYDCSSLVELKEGCNHMTCRCGAQFCMVCGAKWKTCDCPWFNYNTQERARGDILDFNPVPPEAIWLRPRFVVARPRYRDELWMRRDQEQTDHDLAQRLQWLDMED
ncbi:hypothetical protein UA08_02115 [Talaromyces atroroseus]|uniref:RBR-type E3 ubiquitin transferase n=1 Tax=Talaromyces atroroseus TaxID=1441469 RepID=A0A1Q5QBP7_TALAT|nr:hypothetical protein UA08_02115 [Talaromyces atroroseus]OKL63336.1 hypothetical protein UA08_02115 [Talaromyces atroroseus]